MSRRKRQPAAAIEPAASSPEKERSPGGSSRRLPLDLGILTAVFAVTVGIAELAGAANLGVSFGIGQVAFAIALMALLLRA
jgi:hypothetical protein